MDNNNNHLSAKQVIAQTIAYLTSQIGFELREANNIALILLEAATKQPIQYWQLNGSSTINPNQYTQINEWLQTLKQTGIPVQYLLQKTWFYGLPIQVSPQVLIPRPETEELVRIAIEVWDAQQNGNKHPDIIVDAGTGSGCIALALRQYYNNLNHDELKIIAFDISLHALDIAQSNAYALQLPIETLQIDLAKPQTWKSSNLPAKIDLLLSNPPYIAQHEAKSLHPRVSQHEPHLALFAPDQNPLFFYEQLAKMAAQFLTSQGLIAAELNPVYATETAQIWQNYKLENIKIHLDMSGKQRIITASKN